MGRESIRGRVRSEVFCRVCFRGERQCAAPTNYGEPAERKPHDWTPDEYPRTRETRLLLRVADAADAVVRDMSADAVHALRVALAELEGVE